jgi:hypothetical protein
VSRFQEYRDALRALRIEVPIGVPVRVRLSHNRRSKSFGWCGIMTRKGQPSGFSITVSTWIRGRRCTAEEMRDTIVHEWAHARSNTRCTTAVDSHGPEWGLSFSPCYQAAIED